MKLLVKKKKTPEIPIIPLIDILAILLIFFIVSTTFKDRSVLEIDLPTVKELPSTSISDQRKVLAVDEQGTVTFDLVEVEIEKLGAYLITHKNADPNLKVELEADEKVELSLLFQIWDALTEAEIQIKDVPARIKLPGN